MAKNAVVVKFLADVAGLQKGIGDVDKKLGLFGKGVKALGITLATAFSAKEILNFSKQALKAASDLDESINKVNAVFGLSGETIKTWSENSVLSFGLSQQAALEAAGTFGNLFTAFGVGIPEAEKMSRALTELAADLASFNNTSIDQALTALRSGLSGETEPLKRFGVALSQAAIEAEALALGLMNSGDEITQAAKSQAIYSLVMKQTANAQGDFQRTSDGLANTMRTLEAAVEDAKASVGEGFVRAAEAAIDAVGGRGGLSETIENSGEKFGDFTLGVALAIEKLDEWRDKKRGWLGPLESIGDLAYKVSNELSGGLVESVAATTKALTLAGNAENAFAQSVAYADKQSRIAANNLRGKFVPDTIKAAQAAKVLEDQALQTASAIRAMTGAGSTPENARAVRQMDSFGRTIDKQSIYWKNAKEENADYWDSISTGSASAGGSVKKLGDDVIKEGKKVKNFTAEIGDFTLSVAQKAAKGKKISADAIKAMTEAGQEAIQGLLDDLADAEAKLVETQKFIAQQTASFLGPTSVKAVQQTYAAAKSEAEQLTRAYYKAQDAANEARKAGTETDAKKARIAELDRAAYEAKKAADEAGRNAAKGFDGFWREAQESVAAYRGELDRLRKSFEEGGITQAEAQIFQDVFSLPPDTGTQLINELLTESGKALTDNQQTIINDTNAWMAVITDTFAGENGYPAVGYTAASTMVTDLATELRSEDTKTKVRKAVRAAVPKSVKVRVKWEYDAFVPPVPGRISASSSTKTIQDIQAYERMNGSKWRERVR